MSKAISGTVPDAIYPAAAIVAEIEDFTAIQDASGRTRYLRSYSFLIAWTEVESAPKEALTINSPAEYIMLLPDADAEIIWKGGKITAPGRSVVIVPEGKTSVRLLGAGQCLRMFAPIPASLEKIPVLAADKTADKILPLRPIDPPYRRKNPNGEPVVHQLASYPNSVGMPRAKLFQSATMSINWVEYKGPRDRKNLSPHLHTDFEQASIVIEGDFVHHYRTNWAINANYWRADEHLRSGPGSATLIPPPIIHTAEGVSTTRQILIDVFAPPRADFIAKGQILNSGEYIAPGK